jgi:hypothetical protein
LRTVHLQITVHADGFAVYRSSQDASRSTEAQDAIIVTPT